jgi:hypothetical protein
VFEVLILSCIALSFREHVRLSSVQIVSFFVSKLVSSKVKPLIKFVRSQ